MKSALLIACLLGAIGAALAIVPADEITSLPGWDGPLPSRQFSGYMAVGPNKDRFIHYWFVESEGDPTTDPVVMWMNGGPGASSLIGFFTENGPFTLNDNSVEANSSIPRLQKNPYSWSTIANTLYIESPAGVGFSYCLHEEDCWFNDTKTAEDNYDFLDAFFTAYSEYKAHDFYITGESYAGIYIPTLVQQIEAHPEAGINLKGFAIGDGCIGNDIGSCGNYGMPIQVDFFHGQAFCSQDLYDEIQKTCTDWVHPSAACDALIKTFSDEIGKYYVYDVYSTCGSDQMETLLDQYVKVEGRGYVQRRMLPEYTAAHRSDWRPRGDSDSGANYVCGGDRVMAIYLALPSVIEAIHVKTNVPHFKFNYTGNVKDLLPAYPGFIDKYRVLIYSGNFDACIPYPGTESWTSGLGLPIVDDWRPWHYSNTHGTQVGGFVTTYTKDFAFLIVKASGHMVPQFQPNPALTMITNFINGSPY